MEHGAEEAKRTVGRPETVAVCQIKHLTINFQCGALAVDGHAAFLFKIVVHPEVVVAREEMHLHAHVGQFADFSKQARVALRDDVFIFVPEVENVAQEINGIRLMLDAVEKIDQAALLSSGVWNGQTAQVGVGEEIDIFHWAESVLS